MKLDLRRSLATLPILFILAACSGGATASTPGGGSTPAASQPGASLTASQPVPTDGGTQTTPAPSQPGSTPAGAGGVGDVCQLVTATELEQALGMSPVTTRVVAGPPDTCDIQVDGAPIAAIVYLPSGARNVFGIASSGADAQKIDGLGDGAFYSTDTHYVVVLKGDSMVSIAAYPPGTTEDQQTEIMKAIARAAAPRM